MKQIRVIIAGGREFNDYQMVEETCDFLFKDKDNTEIEIVSGKAKGADSLGEKYAKEKGYPVVDFPADWSQYGKSAGYKRNKQMAEYANVLVAFWDGNSKGTKLMIELAKSNNLLVRVKKY